MKQYKYAIKGTILGSRCYGSYTEDVAPEEMVEYMEEISTLFPRDPEDELAQYIHEWEYDYSKAEVKKYENPLKKIITEIWVGVKQLNGTLYSWTEVTSERELDDIEKCLLLDYLSGQFSDGYGEGLEQQEFNSYTETEEREEWDEEEQEIYMEEYDVRVDMYLHLWQPKNFRLEFVNSEDYEVKKVDLKKPEVTKPRCKLIGEDGNIFNLIGIAARSLRRVGLEDKVTEMSQRVMQSQSYTEALSIIMEYVEVE